MREFIRHLTRSRIMAEAAVPAGNQVALIPDASIHGKLLRQRVVAAARLYHAGAVSHLILSGDGASASHHEPHAMRQMLRRLGVPDHAMVEDAAGLSTSESIQRAGQMAAGRRLIVITQELHCPRAILLAWGMGVDALACALPSSPTDAGRSREDQLCVRTVLDLAGLRAWTQRLEEQGKLSIAGWTLASL